MKSGSGTNWERKRIWSKYIKVKIALNNKNIIKNFEKKKKKLENDGGMPSTQYIPEYYLNKSKQVHC